MPDGRQSLDRKCSTKKKKKKKKKKTKGEKKAIQ